MNKEAKEIPSDIQVPGSEPKKLATQVDEYYKKLIVILDEDLKFSIKRMDFARMFLVLLIVLGLYIMCDTSCFVEKYIKSISDKQATIPEKFAITYIVVSATKLAAIVAAVSTFLFRGFPHQKMPDSTSK